MKEILDQRRFFLDDNHFRKSYYFRDEKTMPSGGASRHVSSRSELFRENISNIFSEKHSIKKKKFYQSSFSFYI